MPEEFSPSGRKQFPLFMYTRPIIALIIVLFSFGFMFALLFKPIPANNKETINLVVGFVLGVTGTVASYYFATSKDKSDQEQKTLSAPDKEQEKVS